MQKLSNSITGKGYFLQRIESLGLSEKEANQHGLFPDEKGNILQLVKHFNGEHIRYFHHKDIKRISANKTLTPIMREQLYYVTRLTPEALHKNPDLPKYLLPKKQPAFPIPTRSAIRNFNSFKTGGTIVFTEGYFKCVAMDLHGLESFAFTGITHYKISEAVKEYLLRRQPDQLVMLYDADGKDIKEPKENKAYNSKRVEDFCRSATKFAAQFFDLREKYNLPTQLFFAMVNPSSKQKGIDDLLQAASNPKNIIEQLKGEADNTDIIRFKLSKSSYKKKLLQHFCLDVYRSFYNYHQKQIGEKPFIYKGNLYQAKDTGFGKQRSFKLLNDPYKIDLQAEQITVNKYLSEAKAQLDNILKNYKKVALKAPTGAGKNTFTAGLTERSNEKIVVVCPTVNLAKQQARKTKNAIAITGRRNASKIQRAFEKDIIFCTYDTLHHIPDLWRRILVIDEAHDLVNQHNFRLETLRRVITLSNEAKQTVLLSGTMPDTLCKAFNFHVVNVHTKYSNKVNVFVIEADGTRQQAITGCLLTQLKQNDFSTDKVHIAFLNNTAKIEDVRQQLVKDGTLTAEQIAVVTRSHANAGEDEVLKGIVNNSEIGKGIKLVLCTCLISEGVNIENKNIGRVFVADPRCPDLFQQFVARFRNIPRLPVFLILPKEKDLNNKKGIDADILLEQKKGYAGVQLKSMKRLIEKHRNEYSENELPFLENIESSTYSYTSNDFPYIYKDKEGELQIDQLKILADIRYDRLMFSNNAYLLQQITAAPNIHLYSIEEKETDKNAAEGLKIAKEEQKKLKKESIEELKKDLAERPQTVVKALQLRYGKDDRNGRKFINVFAEDLLPLADEKTAKDFLETHDKQFSSKWYRNLIRDYTRLVFAGIDADKITEILQDYSPAKFTEAWEQLKQFTALKCYTKRSSRKYLNTIHAGELRLRISQAKSVLKLISHKGNMLTAEELQKAIQKPVQRKIYNNTLEGELEKVTHITTEKAVKTVKGMFNVIEHKRHTGIVYEVREKLIDLDPEILQKLHDGKMQFLQGIANSFLLKPLKILRVYEIEG